MTCRVRTSINGMGVPGYGDLRGCDQVRGFSACPCGQVAPDPARPAARALPGLFLPRQVDAVTASDAMGSGYSSQQAKIGCRVVPAYRNIQLHLLLLVGLLMALPVPAQPPAVRTGTGGGGIYPAHEYPQGDGGANGPYLGSRGDEPSFDYAWPNPDAGWGPNGAFALPPGNASNPRRDDSSFGSFPDARSPAPAFPIDGPHQVGHPGPWAGQGGEGFRFRGDKEVSEGRWRESPSAPGFRFRPLSPEERERSAGSDGWRPIRREDRGPAGHGEVEPRGAEAFGYQSDSWFRRYYGERP